MRRLPIVGVLLGLMACGDDASVPDAMVPPDGRVADARVVAAGAVADASSPDAPEADASVADASSPDAPPADASSPDARPPDASLADARPPDASPVDAGPVSDAALATVEVTFAGDALGEVEMVAGPHLLYCPGSCSVPVAPGDGVNIRSETTSLRGGWGGACAGSTSDEYCQFTAGPGVNAVTVTFNRLDREQWTRLLIPGGLIQSADYDAQGNLIVGTSRGLFKMTGAGVDLWSLPAVRGVARVDRAGDIVVVSPPNLIKVSSAGAVVWTRDAGLGIALPTVTPRLGHRHAIAPNGDIAVMNTSVQVWSGAGEHRWTRSVFRSRGVVAIDSIGVVHVPAEDPVSIDATRAKRFAADGTPLTDSALLGGEYWTSLDLDSADNYVASTSGRGHLDVNRVSQAGQRLASTQLVTRDGDYVDNGVVVDSFDHAISAYAVIEAQGPYEGFRASRISPTGQVGWSLDRVNYGGGGGMYGFTVHDLAADGAGNVAVVGGYSSMAFVGAWIQVFRFAAK